MEKGSVVGASAWGIFMWRVVAVLVIGALLARWVWVFFAPVSEQILPASQQVSGFQAEHLFGIAAVSVEPVQAVVPNVRLVGVFAGTPGFAVLELDGQRQVGVVTGKEVATGAWLVEVAIDHVVIESNGVRQQIDIEKNAPVRRESADAELTTAQ